MMGLSFAVAAAIVLVLAATVQLLIAARFRKSFVGSSSDHGRAARPVTGKAAVLMCLRGSDPTLQRALVGVLDQNYKNLELHIVVDHLDDPSMVTVNRICQQHAGGDRVQVHPVQLTLDTCSLKCLGLFQAASRLPEDVEFVVLVDADVDPHPDWLTDLLQPLADTRIGGVTGAQWFEPPVGAGLGTWIRSVWNSGALILTMCFANPWAGSFAMRRSDLLESGLLNRWQTSIVDDGPIRSSLESIGKPVVLGKSLVMVNREKCTLGYAVRWSRRMLTWSRLYEPTFWVSILHAVFSNVVMLVNFGLLGLSCAGWLPPAVAAISLIGLVFAGGMCVAAVGQARRCVNHSRSLRGYAELKTDPYHLVWAFVCAAPSHLMFGVCCALAIFTKRIQWRGINYTIKRGQVKRLNYERFRESQSTPDHSI